MNPIRNLRDVKENWRVFEERWKALYAFFLYTDEDKNIARYVREHFNELDKLSGPDCLVFLIEKPPTGFRGIDEVINYRKNEKETLFFLTSLHSEKKSSDGSFYDKAEVYEIARNFEIDYTDIPCIVFFRDINDKKLLIYRLDNSWSDERLTREFRELFAFIRESIKDLQGVGDEEMLWEKLEKFVRRKNRNIDREITKIINLGLNIVNIFNTIFNRFGV